MERHIIFNICSLVNTEGLQEIAWTLKPDTAVRTGTRTRLPAGSNCTDKSFGCLYSLGQAFSTSYDQGSQCPLGLTGWTRRCDSAERRYDGSGHLGVKVQMTASRQLMDWTRTRLSSGPGRVITTEAGDLKSGVGTFRDGTKPDCVSVGEFHNASQNEAGDNFVEMSMSLQFGVLNTL